MATVLKEIAYSLRYKVLNELLKYCTRVKTVSLCQQLVEEFSHSWVFKSTEKIHSAVQVPGARAGVRSAGLVMMQKVGKIGCNSIYSFLDAPCVNFSLVLFLMCFGVIRMIMCIIMLPSGMARYLSTPQPTISAHRGGPVMKPPSPC